MDISMPVMNGYEASQAIRQFEKSLNLDRENTFIVGLTAHTTQQFRQQCFNSGMDDFSKFIFQILANIFLVTKPVDLPSLEKLLKKHQLIN